ncbi:universal stress protein [Halobacteria archaeon AArc-dxtr1]|nr:universal stress protein [Halobacteria archaeon AArc-dxtr1]
MYTLLVPIDTSEQRALRQVQWISNLPNAADTLDVLLLFVFESATLAEVPSSIRSTSASVDIVPAVRKARQYLQDHEIDVTVIDRRFNTTAQIRRVAETHDVDTIVLGGRRNTIRRNHIMQSTTYRLLYVSERPVVVA